MTEALAPAPRARHGAPVMLTGTQIAAARKLAGIKSQQALADALGLGRATIERAEKKGDDFPTLGSDDMARMVRLFEASGVEFSLAAGTSAPGGLAMRKKASP